MSECDEIINSDKQVIADLRAEIEAIQKALKPMIEPGKIFGDDWSDNDELAVMPFNPDEEYGYDLLFTMKVGDYRTAAKMFDTKPRTSDADYKAPHTQPRCGTPPHDRRSHERAQ